MNTVIIGPLAGYYVATYACPVGDLGDRFVGYYKVYPFRPGCFCEDGHLLAGCTSVGYPAADRAMHEAVILARQPLAELPVLRASAAPLRPVGSSAPCCTSR